MQFKKKSNIFHYVNKKNMRKKIKDNISLFFNLYAFKLSSRLNLCFAFKMSIWYLRHFAKFRLCNPTRLEIQQDKQNFWDYRKWWYIKRDIWLTQHIQICIEYLYTHFHFAGSHFKCLTSLLHTYLQIFELFFGLSI